jgi:hypothetical protein
MSDKDDMQGLPDEVQLDREGPADDIPASAKNPNVAHVQYLDEPPVKRGPGRRQYKSPAQEQIRARFKKVHGRSITSVPDDDARAIRLLDVVRDELELAGRPPGDLVTITRQANDSCINNLAIVARLIRKMAERW